MSELMDPTFQRQWLELVNECYDELDLATLIPLVRQMKESACTGEDRNVAVMLFGYGAAAVELAKYGGHEYAERKQRRFLDAVWTMAVEHGSVDQSEAEYEAFMGQWHPRATRHHSRPFCVSDAQWTASIPIKQKKKKKAPIIVRFDSEVDMRIRA